MKNNTRSSAVKIVGAVITGLLAFGLTSGPANAVVTKAPSTSLDARRDTGW
ncbi:MAG: hypothetical protein QM655_04135 [Nocardioidaceae bacterium]